MKILIKLTALAVLAIAIIVGCQKFSEKDIQYKLNDEFTVASVKQWYIQSFQRTEIWKDAWLQAKKFSDWKNGIYYKSKGLEFLAFPLLKQKSKFFIPSDSSLSITQIQKIAAASLSKVLFIRNANHEVFVREVDYIPDWQYLQRKQFDISKVNYDKPGDDFTGTMIIKDWNEKILSMRFVNNGKIVKTVSLNGTTSHNNSGNRTASCSWVQYCMWYEDCRIIGDQWTDDCGEPYMDPNDCYWDEVCDGNGNDDDPCTLYGIGCGGPPSGDPPPADPCANANVLAQNASFIEKMQDLFNRCSTDNHETAYLMKDNNGTTTYTYDDLGPGGTNFNYPPSYFDNAIGFIHNHENNPTNISIFTLDDLQTLYGAISNATVTHKQDFTFGLVTAQGTRYLLTINDLTKFEAWGANTLSGALYGIFNQTFNQVISTANTSAENESHFAQLLTWNGGSGLTLLKANNGNFNAWSKVEKDANGNLIITSCN